MNKRVYKRDVVVGVKVTTSYFKSLVECLGNKVAWFGLGVLLLLLLLRRYLVSLIERRSLKLRLKNWLSWKWCESRSRDIIECFVIIFFYLLVRVDLRSCIHSWLSRAVCMCVLSSCLHVLKHNFLSKEQELIKSIS